MNYSSETADAVIKNHLFYKIKTDLASSNNSTINPQNEVYNYTRIVRPNEIWKDNPVNYSVSFTQISMTDINPNIQNLKKRSWKLPDLNCPVVPHTYGATFIPIFQYSTNYTNINAITTPYTFDYFTGILTFLSNLPSFGTNDLVYCSGYTYTGSNLTTISGLLFSPGNNNIGISSSIPSQKLDVTGNIYVSSNIFTNSNITTINGNYLVGSTVIVDNNRNFSNVNNLYCPTGNIIGNIATLNQPFVTSMPVLNTIGNLSTTTVGIGSTNQILTFNGSTINLNPLSSGCVAIGKATATQLLDVAGNINSSSNLTVSNNITGSGNIITSGNYYSSTLQIIDNNRNILNINDINASGNIKADTFVIGTVYTSLQGNIFTLPNVTTLGNTSSGNINIGNVSTYLTVLGSTVNINGNLLSGNVGIGSTNPSQRLSVNGSISATNGGTFCINDMSIIYPGFDQGLTTYNIGNVNNLTATNINGTITYNYNNQPNIINIGSSAVDPVGIGTNTQPITIYGSTVNINGNLLSGNVGIGSTNPSQRLSVNGSISVTNSGTFRVNDTTVIDGNRNIILGTANITTTGNITGNIITATQPFVTYVGSSATGNVGIGSTSQTLNLNGSTIVINGSTTGCVAIGKTTTPLQTLDVNGIINSSSGYYVANNPIIDSNRNINIGSGNIITTGNITANSPGFLIGTINTVSQPNITTIGNVTSIGTTTSANITIGNSSTTSGIVLNGNIVTTKSSMAIGRTNITPGQSYLLDVNGAINSTSIYISGNLVSYPVPLDGNSVTNTLPVSKGGTGISSIAVNSIPYATSTNVIGTSGNLIFNGNTLTVTGNVSATTFSGSGANLTSLSAGNISSGTLAVARGGTGISSIAVNSIPYATSTNVIGTSTNLTYDTTDNILGNPTILSFKSNPGGGSGYNASIKYWYYSGQNSYLMLSTNGSSSEHIYLNSSGNVQIGNSPIFPDANTGSYKLNVVGSIYSSGGFTTGGTISSGNNNISCGTGNITCGNVNASGDVTAAFTSDDRLKIKTDLIDKPIEKINSLTAFKYTYNDLAKSLGLSNEKVQIGLSAQDVQKVLPEAIRIANFDMDFENNKSKSGNNYLAIDYVRLVPLLIEAIKEQQKTIDEINSKLNSLLVQ